MEEEFKEYLSSKIRSKYVELDGKNKLFYLSVEDKKGNVRYCETLERAIELSSSITNCRNWAQMKTKESLSDIEKYKNFLFHNKKLISNETINKDFLSIDEIKKEIDNIAYTNKYINNNELEYDKSTKTIIINYRIPNTSEIPKIIEYKYNKITEEFEKREMKKKDFIEYYNSIVFQISLLVLKKVFMITNACIVNTIVFNGWTEYINTKIGQDERAFIISLMVERKKYDEINLDKINAKDCIHYLNAVYSSTLSEMTPIKPILNIDKNDSRFVDNKNIISELDDGVNLAEMPWDDFEYLVRDLFEKIFSNDGSEVKVTQASRDGGVDAIAFDMDPIKGGKYIIQAKRYNNVVPVSAVRDLYGTVINEGAIKGILVTTSYFGNDSLEFSINKPITLLDGNNIVYLLNKYGYNAKIKLKNK